MSWLPFDFICIADWVVHSSPWPNNNNVPEVILRIRINDWMGFSAMKANLVPWESWDLWIRWHCSPDTGLIFEPWGRARYLSSRRLPTILKFYECAGKKHVVSFKHEYKARDEPAIFGMTERQRYLSTPRPPLKTNKKQKRWVTMCACPKK